MVKMDAQWVGRIDEKVYHCEIEVGALKDKVDSIRAENQECRMELKSEIHDLAKWRERILVYLVIGGFITAYAAKHILDIYFK